MKQPNWSSKSQSFAVVVIQSVFDYLNFLVSYICHLALVGHVLPQQANEVLFGAPLTTGKGPGKVDRAAQRFFNPAVPAEFFAVVVSQCFDSGLIQHEHFDNRRLNQVSCFV
jgi:hypothetical protein